MSLLAALATGLLLWVCYPPAAIGPFVWWALLPLLAVLWPQRARPIPEGAPPKDAGTTASPATRPAWWRPTRAAGALLHGYLAGATFFLLNLNWLHHVTAAGMVMLALYLAIFPALWALFAATVGRPRRWDSGREVARGVLLTAAAWTGLEWLRGIVLTGFGWNGLGVALDDSGTHAHFRQWAEWIGVTGLSFFVAAHAAVVMGVWRMDRHRQAPGRPRRLSTFLAKSLASLGAAHLALTSIGSHRAKSVAAAMENAPPLTVALIQPNVPQETKNRPEAFDEMAGTLARLTRQAFASGPPPGIVVWPESSLPAPYYYEGVQEVLRQGAHLGEFTHVLGIDDQDLDAYYNSIAVFRGDPLAAALHRKVHLVPFGEYLPARGLFGRFDFIREQLPGDFKAGDSTDPVPLPLMAPLRPAPESPGASTSTADPNPPVSVIPLVCFEDTLGRVARRFARNEPQIIINVTNDAWFQDSAGADQHLANARFRAIELRRPMLRAANTGVTAVIDPLGRVTARLPRLHEGMLKTSIPRPTIKGQTLYVRCGDLFSQLMLGLAGLAAAPSLLRRASRRGGLERRKSP